MTVDRAVRKWIPSLSKLTYNPIFRTVVNAFDFPLRALIPEFRSLPPNHMRIRVGVGNRLLFNHLSYLVGPKSFWMYAFARGWCNLESTIVDLGCGCGRYAYHLRELEFGGGRFTGRYYGIDIDSEMLAWCRSHFDQDRFRFLQATDKSLSYNRPQGAEEPYRVSLESAEADLVFSTSLFTHLLEPQLVNYIEESFRLLRPGGWSVHTCFCLDHLPPTYGDRHTFSHKKGSARVESLRQPEAAVAYREQFLIETARHVGFSECGMLVSNRGWQPVLCCRRP